MNASRGVGVSLETTSLISSSAGVVNGHDGATPTGYTFSHGRPLSICLDARKIGDGGLGTYVENLIEGLLPYVARGEIRLTLVILTTLQEHQRARWAQSCTLLETSITQYSPRELFSLTRFFPWHDIDVWHSPHYPLPLSIPVPAILTVHDLLHLTHPPKWFHPFVALPLIAQSIARANSLICVSHATKDVLRYQMKKWHVSLPPCSVVPNAVINAFVTLPEDHSSTISRASEIPTPYFLAVLSNLKPHKGLDRLLHAFTEALNLMGRDPAPRLVLVGRGFQGMSRLREIPEVREALFQFEQLITVEGSVSEAKLRRLMTHARALVVASDQEGFCLPVIESHAVGTPVVTTPIPAVMEILAPSDLSAESFDSAALALVMAEAWNVPRRIPSSVCERFSIETTTAATLGIYRQSLHTRLKGFR